MSDMLNEKFEEFVTESGLVVEAGDPMPTVSASVIPGGGSHNASGQSKTEVNSRGGSADPQPSVGTEVAPAGQSVTDTGGPRPDGNDEGEENPGAKASAPVSQVSGDPQQRGTGKDEPSGSAPKFGAEIAYGTKEGPDVGYPIKPSFEELDMSADVAALTEGTELSEEFKEKATTIFEAAVKSKLSEEWKKLEEQFATKVSEQVEATKKELAEEVNGTINYAIQKWLEENQVSVDRGIRNEITEDFIVGLKNLFEEHYINVPDDKIDVVEGMAEDIREMEQRLDEQVKRNVELHNRLNESTKQIVLNTVSEGLVETHKEKLASLAEGIEFTSEEEYSKKLNTIKESYFKEGVAKTVEEVDETPVENTEVSASMAAYLQAINRWQS